MRDDAEQNRRISELESALSASKAENERLRGELRFADAAIAQWKSNANVEAEDRFALAEKLKGCEWIPVTERLPDSSDVGSNSRTGMFYVATLSRRTVPSIVSAFSIKALHDSLQFVEATHWMRIPSPLATQSALAGEKKL